MLSIFGLSSPSLVDTFSVNQGYQVSQNKPDEMVANSFFFPPTLKIKNNPQNYSWSNDHTGQC